MDMTTTLKALGALAQESRLMKNCCQGQPNLCSTVLDSLLPGCCANPDTPGEQHEKNAR
jgi:hypothetical protein